MLSSVQRSHKFRSGGGLCLAEAVATCGLRLVICGGGLAGRASMAPFAVGAYIAGAYWFTASTSFANPAVTIAREFSNTFAGVAPSSAPAFIAAQAVGAVLAVLVIRLLYPDIRDSAARALVPHEIADEASRPST